MGNLLCVLAHCSGRGEEIIAGDKSHIFLLEQGNIAQVGCTLNLQAGKKIALSCRADKGLVSCTNHRLIDPRWIIITLTKVDREYFYNRICHDRYVLCD